MVASRRGQKGPGATSRFCDSEDLATLKSRGRIPHEKKKQRRIRKENFAHTNDGYCHSINRNRLARAKPFTAE